MEETINNIPLSQYGAILMAGAYAELLKPAEVKPGASNNDPRKNGTEYIERPAPKVQERTLSLVFGINGNNEDDFLAKYNAFVALLQTEFLELYVPRLSKTFRLKYEACTQFDNFNLRGCKIAVKFTEPNPANRS